MDALSSRKDPSMRASRIAAAVFVALLLPAALAATPPAEHRAAPPDFGRMFHRAAERLDLTPEQTRQVHGIFAGHRDEVRAGIASLLAAHKALFAAVSAPTVDEGALRAAAHAAGQAHEELAVAHAHLIAELGQVLTPEQIRRAHQLLAGIHAHVAGFLTALQNHLDAVPTQR
jgi:Spy/CpxP family protein refolding chaperone